MPDTPPDTAALREVADSIGMNAPHLADMLNAYADGDIQVGAYIERHNDWIRGEGETPDDYTWRVTNRDGKVTVEMGTSTQGTSVNVIYLGMGRALIKLGQQFLENVGSAHDDDE